MFNPLGDTHDAAEDIRRRDGRAKEMSGVQTSSEQSYSRDAKTGKSISLKSQGGFGATRKVARADANARQFARNVIFSTCFRISVISLRVYRMRLH